MENLKLIANNIYVQIVGDISDEVSNKISVSMSYMHQGQLFIRMKNGGSGWDGRVRLLKGKTFPVGLLKRCEQVLNDNSIKYYLEDNRTFIEKPNSLKISKESGFVPRDYQRQATMTAIKEKSGIIKAATGAGKTSIIAMLAGHYNTNTVIYVIGVELLYQMKKTLNWLYPELEVGMVGDGKCDVKKITIATIWSAAAAFNKKAEVFDSDIRLDRKKVKDSNKQKIKNMVRAANLFVLDECQFAAAKTVQFLHESSFNAAHRFLFSASPWRDTGDDILIEAVGGPKLYDISASKLIKKGFLVKPRIYFMDVPPIRKVGEKYTDVYKNFIVDNEERNDLIVNSVSSFIKKRKKVLVLVVRVAHGEKLLKIMRERGMSVDFLDGKKTAAKRISCIENIQSGEIDVLIASKIFDQGVDIPELDALVLAGSGKSSGRALQRIGRVIRKHEGKEIAVVVEFMDNAKYLRDHSKARQAVYSTESEFEIIIQKPKDLDAYIKRKKVNWL